MEFVSRWLAYRRIVRELTDLPSGFLAELGVAPKSVTDFAWRCASIEIARRRRVLAPFVRDNVRAAGRL